MPGDSVSEKEREMQIKAAHITPVSQQSSAPQPLFPSLKLPQNFPEDTRKQGGGFQNWKIGLFPNLWGMFLPGGGGEITHTIVNTQGFWTMLRPDLTHTSIDGMFYDFLNWGWWSGCQVSQAGLQLCVMRKIRIVSYSSVLEDYREFHQLAKFQTS